MTPFEAWMGEKPNVEHLRTFGCVVYAHVAKDERKKLDLKTRKCVFLGYGTETKGYRLYDPKRARVFYSRDVVFNEWKRGIEKQPSSLQEENCNYSVSQQWRTSWWRHRIAITTNRRRTSRASLTTISKGRQPTDFYSVWINIPTEVLNEPACMTEALASPDKAKWIEAMEVEMESLHKNDVWDSVKLPSHSVLPMRWLFEVTQTWTQEKMFHHSQVHVSATIPEPLNELCTFAPNHRDRLWAWTPTCCPLLSAFWSCTRWMWQHSWMVSWKEVYMKQPEGFIAKGQEDLVCKLKRRNLWP